MKLENGLFRFDDFELDVRRRELYRGDEIIALQPKVFEMLVYLLRNTDRVVSKSELLDEVWRGTLVTDNVLAQAASALRKALGDSSRSPRYVKAVPRVGYRFIGDVESPASARDENRHRIAVLPFLAFDEETRDSALESGMAESLVSRLSNLAGFVVRPLASVRQVVAQTGDPVAAGVSLDVESVLAGRIGQSEQRVRVSFELLSVKRNEVLLSRVFNESLADIFEVQDAICDEVVREVSPRVDAGKPGAERTSVAAYRAYLEGRLFLGRFTQHDVERAVPLFETSLDEDPAYAPAWASLAECHDFFGTTGANARQHYRAAKRASTRALNLDDGLPEAKCMQAKIAWQFDWNWGRAASLFSAVAGEFPNRADVLIAYSDFCCYMKDEEQSVELAKRALDIDPVSPWVNTLLAQAFHMAGRDDEAIMQGERALDLAPGFPFAHFFLGLSYFSSGDYSRAISELEAAVASGRPDFPAALATLLALSGETDRARPMLEAMISAGDQVPPFARALTYMGFGDYESAATEFTDCVEQRDWHILALHAEPVLVNAAKGTAIPEILDALSLPERIPS